MVPVLSTINLIVFVWTTAVYHEPNHFSPSGVRFTVSFTTRGEVRSSWLLDSMVAHVSDAFNGGTNTNQILAFNIVQR
jgi:hypothetical protein